MPNVLVQRVAGADGFRHGASERPQELRLRPRALLGVRVRRWVRPAGDDPLRDPGHPAALGQRRPLPRAVRGGRLMRVPLRWLRELCPSDRSAEELTALLALKGAHVESIERPWAGLEGVVVARVLEVRDHPDSEKLCVALVDAGEGPVQVVVGVRNMAPGDLVPWARPGSRVPLLDEPLGVRKFGGEVSNGMLCSPRELAVSQEHETGILLLPGDLPVGADLKAVLGLDDVVLDLEIESNRPDLLSITGIAREVAGATGAPLLPLDVEVREVEEPASTVATVEIKDPQGCPRYLARVVKGVGLGRTPLPVQARLTACGVRPLSPVV